MMNEAPIVHGTISVSELTASTVTVDGAAMTTIRPTLDTADTQLVTNAAIHQGVEDATAAIPATVAFHRHVRSGKAAHYEANQAVAMPVVATSVNGAGMTTIANGVFEIITTLQASTTSTDAFSVTGTSLTAGPGTTRNAVYLAAGTTLGIRANQGVDVDSAALSVTLLRRAS